MRHRATPLLHVIACAPVAALAAAALALPWHALAAPRSVPSNQPTPYVVAIDAGHGGTADNNNPDQQFDPGVVAANGLQEKDVALDVAKRVATLLRQDQVDVVMTRSDDRWVDITPRMQTALDAGAQLFVSIHFNSFTDPSTGGALVLYPNDDSLPFAQVMSDALATGLQQRFGIADDGVQSKPDLWVHATMPAVTVEGGYLTNAREADLLTQDTYRQALAEAIRNGIEKQAPEIASLNAQISAWKAVHRAPASHGGVTPAGVAPADTGGAGGALLRWVVVLLVLAGLVRWRRRLVPAVRWAWTQGASLAAARQGPPRGRVRGGASRRNGRPLGDHALTLATSWRSDSPLSMPMSSSQRRRRSARRRAVLQRAARPEPTRRSVYDELWF